MTKAWLNHVSISANDLEESTRFYIEVFGAAAIPTPNFGLPAQWLRLGALQLHLFQRSGEGAPKYHHIGLAVDDFEQVYRISKERGLHDRTTFGTHLREIPGNIVQMYIRDPAHNLVEVNWPDAAGLDSSIRGEMTRLVDTFAQNAENLKGTLYLEAWSEKPTE
jgi:catechol 2,3-dioxygenase-like lactoylglutathione lyase family enzyme